MPTPGPSDPLTLHNLAARYLCGDWTPTTVAAECLRRIEAHADPAIFISLLPRDEIMSQARHAEKRLAAGERLPLLGIPFAIKDNIDLGGHITTAACADFAYRPVRSATVVRQLCEAGAVAIGKTNLDQFATGLVGTRSPYGTPRNPFNANYIPGGSSSGSAVAVSAGLVSFALGTDTAGSGRVPAAFNNIVGLKPTCGRLSTSGVVPACRSIDCVSVFALTCADAAAVMEVAAGYDPQDPYSRNDQQIPPAAPALPAAFRFGVPEEGQLKFFGNQDAEKLYRSAIRRMEALGGTRVVIDLAPFLAAGALLYDGAWVAERLAGLRQFVSAKPDSVLPLTRGILQTGLHFDAVAGFDCIHQVRTLHRATGQQWSKMDVLLLPTTGTIYTLAEIEAEPLKRNANLGHYTTFTNLLDLCAVAVPGGFLSNGLPLGVTLMAPAGHDAALLELGDRLHRTAEIGTGALKYSIAEAPPPRMVAGGMIRLAVVGAHLSGQPLNHQLTSLDARLVRACRTARAYRLYALANTTPAKPGLVRTAGAGACIAVEVWEMTPVAFGRFVASVPAPMAIGSLRLEDGEEVKGFLCEPIAIEGGQDITEFGGWRAYRAAARG
jgi:allophanate hydrolase